MQTLEETHEANVATARAIFAADGLDVGEIDTVVQPDEEGNIVGYVKGEEPPVPSVFRTDARGVPAAGRPQAATLKPVAPIFEADVPKLKKADEPQTAAQQADKLGLHRSTDTQDKGPDAYSSVLLWEEKQIFMLEMDADDVAAFEAEGKTIEEDFQMGFKEDVEFTPEVIERINTVPARRMAYNERIIAHCARGCPQMHPFDIARQQRLWPSQKMDLANAMLTRSKGGFDFLRYA